jgi:hypothetical protein
MEADGSSSNFCGYCNRSGHRTEECRERSNDRRLEIALGCFVGLLLVPFAAFGYVLGIVAGSVFSGIRSGFMYWPIWVQGMKRLFRKEAP